MKKQLVIGMLIISLLCVGLLSGCVLKCPYIHPFIFNLCHYSCSDSAFNNCINDLKTPEQICQYMKNNFHYKYVLVGKSPYAMWKNTWGDCRDYSCFGRYVAQQNGYTAYEMSLNLYVPGTGMATHVMGIYREGSSYSYSDVSRYGGSGFNSFQAIVDDYKGSSITVYGWGVYDNCGKVMSSKGITAKTKFINPGGGGIGTFIGSEPISRYYSRGYNMTIVNKDNPAQYDGTIETIGIYANKSLSNVKVATFYRKYTDTLATRDYVNIGYVGSGEQTFRIDLDVQKGDWIGMYFETGLIATDTRGFDGMWAKGGCSIPCTWDRFTWCDGDTISLGGFVVTP